jgi:putative FmdB family regulatory protein
MPFYLYECSACHCQTEVWQRYTDDALELCPECMQKQLRKVWLPVGVHFKGQGWYQTDKHKAAS